MKHYRHEANPVMQEAFLQALKKRKRTDDPVTLPIGIVEASELELVLLAIDRSRETP
jgi:hypothetical protein